MKMHLMIPAAAAAVLLAGCSSSAPPAGAKHPATSAPATASSSATATASAEPALDFGPNYQKIRDDGTKSFGHYYLISPTMQNAPFAKSFIVQVDDAGAYKPTVNASIDPHKASRYEKYKVTVINNWSSAQPVDTFTVSATDGDGDAPQVFDGDKIGQAPNTPVRPGKSLHWFVAFGNDKGDQTVSIDAALKLPDGTYTGSDSAMLWSK